VRWFTSIRLRIRRHRVALACRDAVELMTEYLEGALPLPEHRRFEAHLAHCDACRAYLDQVRATVEAVGHLRARQLPVEVLDELLALSRRLRAD
jgi:anti-sigma factor RsiW